MSDELGPVPVAVPGDAEDNSELTEPSRFVLDRKSPTQRALAKIVGWGKMKAMADADAKAAAKYDV